MDGLNGYVLGGREGTRKTWQQLCVTECVQPASVNVSTR